MTQVVENLPSILEALGSTPSTEMQWKIKLSET
jgi:hypothetical protein